MMTMPDLPNAAMMRWITYIQLFTFEVQHKPGVSHRVLDGLSQWPPTVDDSKYSGEDINIEDGIKLLKVLPRASEYDEPTPNKDIWVCQDLSLTQLK